ncbi:MULTISPECIES: RteC domain-containing protein [Sphingobacterium]|uniref:RteC domain-containing protein n=1 Tax=Sphingobacterium TaxID=28453 RepID=UPI00257ACAB8|nr:MULTISPECIES: RteC domain-containing protein [Sphingobacterium]
MTKSIYDTIVKRIEIQECKITLTKEKVINEAYQMATFLQEILNETKAIVSNKGFIDKEQEINFFKYVKPQLLGKLIYYNKIYRIETSCPAKAGELYKIYFEKELEKLNNEFQEHFVDSDFYRYIKSGRKDLDEKYFALGNIDIIEGLNSFVFEIDPNFSTYYDYKVAHITADELLYTYIRNRLSPENEYESPSLTYTNYDDMFWTDSKNALIELIYALYAARSLSNGRLAISKISTIIETLFQIELGDFHHAFHRMKVRSGSKTAFLDHLKVSLEEYMNRNL